MRIEKTSTGLVITEPTNEVKHLCLRYFSLNNPVREFFIYQAPGKKSVFNWKGDKETIFITSGLAGIRNKHIEEHILKNVKEVKPRTGADIELALGKKKPRSDMQRDCISKMVNGKSSKLTIQLRAGGGKTFIALYAISQLKKKPLIIVPTRGLKEQWVECLVEEGVPKEDITTSINEFSDKKFCITTIAALGHELRKDWNKLLDKIDRANFGIKIIDEAHLNLKGILQFEGLCNIARNWYLSATLGRSTEAEDNILNRWLSDADRFVGSKIYEEYQKEFVQIYLQDCYYNPSRQLCEKHFRYGKAGLIRATYYRMLLNYTSWKKDIPFVKNVIHMTKMMREKANDKRKILILVPLIDIINIVITRMKEDSYFKDLKISGVEGSISNKERKDALENANIIISTSMSMGTGIDIQDMSVVINFDQYSSPIIIEQIVGRLRDRGWPCHYVDIMDVVYYAKTLRNWGLKRRMILPYLPGVKQNLIKLPTIKS